MDSARFGTRPSPVRSLVLVADGSVREGALARFGHNGLRVVGRTAGFVAMSRRLDHRELVAVNAELRAELRRLHRELERLRVENEILNETRNR